MAEYRICYKSLTTFHDDMSESVRGPSLLTVWNGNREPTDEEKAEAERLISIRESIELERFITTIERLAREEGEDITEVDYHREVLHELVVLRRIQKTGQWTVDDVVDMTERAD